MADIGNVFEVYIKSRFKTFGYMNIGDDPTKTVLQTHEERYPFKPCLGVKNIDTNFYDTFFFPIFCLQVPTLNFTDLNYGFLNLEMIFVNWYNQYYSKNKIPDLTIELYFSEYFVEISNMRKKIGYIKKEIDCYDIVNGNLVNQYDMKILKTTNKVSNPLLNSMKSDSFYRLDDFTLSRFNEPDYFLKINILLPSFESHIDGFGSSYLFYFGIISGCIYLLFFIVNFFVDKYGTIYSYLQIANQTSHVIMPKGVEEVTKMESHVNERLTCKY